jgi:hypothetical protein
MMVNLICIKVNFLIISDESEGIRPILWYCLSNLHVKKSNNLSHDDPHFECDVTDTMNFILLNLFFTQIFTMH